MELNTLSDQISGTFTSLQNFRPELALAVGIFIVLIADLLKRPNFTLVVALTVTLVSVYFNVVQWYSLESSLPLFAGFLRLDVASAAWKTLLGLAAVLTVILSVRTKLENAKGEYYILLLAILLGAQLLVMASHLLMVYLAIEIMSISAYALTALRFDKLGSEASVKYLLFGAVSSALMVYGISWIFTLTGSLHFTDPQFADYLLNAPVVPLVIGATLVLAGIFFKIAAVPMHIWSPDVYTAAPTSIVAFFSTVPKLAGVVFLLKWLLVINLFGLGAVDFVGALVLVSAVTITVGNFSALRQDNVKRMLAYSSIAHTGFLIVPIVSLSEQAAVHLYFYAFVYVLMNLAVFGIVQFFEEREGVSKMSDYGGLINTYPWLSVLMVILMISLAGLPPTGGFTAKLFIFTSLWQAYSASSEEWLLYLLIFGLLNTVVSLFYYLKAPFFMIFRPESKKTNKTGNFHSWENYFIAIPVLAVVVLFFKPDWLMDIINKINFTF